MTIQETMEFIHATSWKGSQLGLERIKELMHMLGDPQDELRFVHIAGTNGKGSIAAMLASVLTEAGYKTGLFTSPYLYRFNERMKINGMDISDEALAGIAEKVKPQVEKMQNKPTEFELITAIAFKYFAEQECDVAVIEVGLGGRLDSTNIINAPEASVITAIDFDHMDILGGTLQKIALEKAGIIKDKVPVVLYGQCAEVTKVIEEKCRECGAPLNVAEENKLVSISDSLFGQSFNYKNRSNIEIPLAGRFQLSNAAVVLDTLDVLKMKGCNISEKAIRNGLKKTEWPGRFEALSREPMFIVDGAHNPNGVKALLGCLEEYFAGKKLSFIIGIMADKDYSEMLKMVMPFAARFICVTPENPRALPSSELSRHVKTVFNSKVIDAGSVESGIECALKSGEPVCAFGSLYMVGKIREYFGMYTTKKQI